MFCSKCGTELPDKSSLCHSCGAWVGTASEVTQLAESPTQHISMKTAVNNEKPKKNRWDNMTKRNKIMGCGCLSAILITIIIIAVVTAGGSDSKEPTAAEISYASEMATHSNDVSDAMYELSNLMDYPNIGDSTWTINVAAELATIQLLYDDALEIDPPSTMAHIHTKYILAMGCYNDATNYLAQGIDEMDTTLIDTATNKLVLGTTYMNEATSLMDEFNEEHGIT